MKRSVITRLAICERKNRNNVAKDENPPDFLVKGLRDDHLEEDRQEILSPGIYEIKEEFEYPISVGQLSGNEDDEFLQGALMACVNTCGFQVTIQELLRFFYILGRKHEKAEPSK